MVIYYRQQTFKCLTFKLLIIDVIGLQLAYLGAATVFIPPNTWIERLTVCQAP